MAWYDTHSAPKGISRDEGFTEIISRAAKRRKLDEEDNNDAKNAHRTGDYAQPYTVPELAQDGVPYLLPTVDGFVVSKDAQRDNERFDASWLRQKPTKAEDLATYNAYVKAGQDTKSAENLEAFSDELFDMIDARQKLLMQNPRYHFLTLVQGFLQTHQQELLLNQNYLTHFKSIFASEISDLQRAYKDVLPFAQSTSNLIQANQSNVIQAQSDMAMAVELVMPPIKVLTDASMKKDVDDFASQLLELVSKEGVEYTLWKSLAKNKLDDKLAEMVAQEPLLATAANWGSDDMKGDTAKVNELSNTLDTIWTRFYRDMDSDEFETNEATRLLKKYSKNVTLQFDITNGVSAEFWENAYHPYLAGVTLADKYMTYTALQGMLWNDATDLVNGSRTLAKTPLTFVQYQSSGKGGLSNPTPLTRSKLAGGLQKFTLPQEQWANLPNVRDELSLFGADIAKGASLGEIYKSATRLFFTICKNDIDVITYVVTAHARLNGIFNTDEDPRDFFNRNAPNPLPQNLQYLFRQNEVMDRLISLYRISADLYFAVSSRKLNIFFDLRLAVLLNAYMYQFVHELAAAILQPTVTNALSEADADRRNIMEAQRQVLTLPTIRDFLKNMEHQRKLLAKVAKRMDPATSGQFIFGPVLVSAIEEAELDFRTDFSVMDPNWQFFDATPTLSLPDIPFKTLFARYVAEMILSGRVGNASVIETKESHLHRSAQLKSIVQKVLRFVPPHKDRASIDAPQLRQESRGYRY